MRKLVMVIYRLLAVVECTSTAVETVDADVADQMRLCLTDNDVQDLARMAVTIEKHYKRPMDIEWGKDGIDGKLYILQARQETVKSRTSKNVLTRYQLEAHQAPVLVTGRSIGQRIGADKVRIITGLDEIGWHCSIFEALSILDYVDH